MRILINALSARQGGGQTYLINLLERLPKTPSLELFVYAPASLKLPDDPRIKRLEPSMPTTNPLIRAVWERFVLPRVLVQYDIDVLFCPGGVLGTRPPAGCKTVTMFRNMLPFDLRARRAMPLGLQRMRLWMLERVMLKSMSSASLVIFIADFARRLIESKVTVKSAVTIPHGVPEFFRTYDSEMGRPSYLPQGEYLLYVSKFDTYKHHFEVVTAYSELPSALRERYKLVLIGESDSAEGQRVRELIERQGLGERVLILGAIKYQDLPAAYRHAALTIFASSCENCPNILLEALGAGRPVLSSSIQPMPEFGGDAVGYFDPYQPESIREAMLNVLNAPEAASEMGGRAAARSQKYSWSATAEQTWRQIALLQA